MVIADVIGVLDRIGNWDSRWYLKLNVILVDRLFVIAHCNRLPGLDLRAPYLRDLSQTLPVSPLLFTQRGLNIELIWIPCELYRRKIVDVAAQDFLLRRQSEHLVFVED